MNNIFHYFLVILLLVLCSGCSKLVICKNFQKNEIENIGISLPDSAECICFIDESGNRITTYKEWVLRADTPFIFSNAMNLKWRERGWGDFLQLSASIINERVKKEFLEFKDIEDLEYTDLDLDDGLQVRIKRFKHKGKYYLHMVFCKL